jgi:HEXXH motif-containing protein
MTWPQIRLSDDQIDELAVRRPAPGTLELLGQGQVALRNLLLRAVLDESAGQAPEAADLLARAHKTVPHRVAEVIYRPLATASATRAIRELAAGGSAAAYLSGTAAAAAIRAGVRFALDVPSPGGRLFLPAVGLAHDLHCETATVRGDGSGFTVGCPHPRVAGAPGPHWRPRRSIMVDDGSSWSIGLDDQDPDRDCLDRHPAPSLAPGPAEALRGVLRGGWQLMSAEHPRYARIARALLRSVVPLADRDDPASSSSRLAVGCVALTPAVPPATASLLIMHETQHNVLDAMLDLIDLVDRESRELHHAPWRLDPRPVRSLLQGAYAHAAVTDYWWIRWQRSRLAADGFEFARWREATTAATATLRRSAELTPAGRRFVDGMWQATAEWRQADLPRSLSVAACEAGAADAVRWRARNRRPDPALIRALHDAFRQGLECPALPVSDVLAADASPARPTRVADVIRGRVIGDPPPAAGDGGPDDYRRRVGDDPSDDDAWAGLAHHADGPAAAALTERPELVRALLLACRDDGHETPAPEDIAEWLVGGRIHGGRSHDDTIDSSQYDRLVQRNDP